MSTLVSPERAGEEQSDAPGSLPPTPPQPAPLRTVLLRGAFGTLQAAAVAALVLQAATFGLFYPRWLKDQLFDGLALYVDTLVVWMVLLFLWAVIGRLWWAIGLLMATVVVVGVANVVKMRVREEPVYPSDVDFLSEPAFLTSMVSPLAVVVALAAVAAIVVWAVRKGRRLDVLYPRPAWSRLPRGQAVAVVGLRLGVGAVAGLLLLQATHFNQPGNFWRGMYELRGDHWRYWNQKTNYRSNGFVGGFLFNMPIDAMKKPGEYDAAAMEDVADRYAEVAAQINRTRTGSLGDVNVVLVLSESFSDPTQLDGFDLERDPIPRTRALMGRTLSGQMLAQMYGGGTANMEFETLTGQSLGLFRPQMLSPYQMLVPEQADYPSAVGWFRAHGHEAVAIHPYRVGMYKREQVYERFGFESFVHDTTMGSSRTIDDSPYVSDEAAFDEVLSQIASREKPLLVNLVTMQNHIPVEDNYDDPIGVDGVDGGQAERIGQYARGLEHTDEALADFLAELERSPEETVVLFYGDHLPGIYDSWIKDENRGLALYSTPFLIWSNRPGRNVPRSLSTTSPAFFLPLLHEVADAPVPPYLALLESVHRRIGALQQGRILDQDGEVVRESELDAEARQLLADMRLVQFDFSIGHRYALDRMWPGAVG